MEGAMPAKITREVLESYLKCQYKANLQLAGARGSTSDYEILLSETRARLHVAAAVNLAREQKCDVLRDLALTFEVLKRGVPVLLDVTAEDEQMSIRFDGLRRSAGSSTLGDFHYIPILVHEDEMPGKQQRAMLELLGVVLGAVQGKDPCWGILIHGRGCNVRRVKLGGGITQARRTLQQLSEMRGTGTPPRLRLNSHCQVCEFRQRCHAEATAKDDLSLLRGMGEKEMTKYNCRGIFTVTQLSCTFRPKKRRDRSKQQGHLHQHPLQALAIRDKKIYVLGAPELPKSAVRIFFDVEGDPDRGFDYLLGMIVEVHGAEQCYSFWAESPADEPCLFHQFLEVVSTYDDFWLYSYGSYDAAFLRRMIRSSGRPEFAKGIMARSLNVLSIIYAHVYFPSYSNSLKDIGRYLGFDWSEADASGIQSIVWRRRWEETRSASLKEKLATYNAEDCAALRRVTQFLYAILPSPRLAVGAERLLICDGHEVSRVEQIDAQWNRREWGSATFVFPEFQFINERAYFDYQQDKVFIRTGTNRTRRRPPRNRGWKKRPRANRHVEVTSRECPSCGGTELTGKPDGRCTRQAFDLWITPTGVRRRVTRYTTSRYRCHMCKTEFLPQVYLRLEEHCHSLKSWAMYEHLAHRMSFASVAETLNDCFGLPIHATDVCTWKSELARYHEATYRGLIEKIVAGPLIHADETEVHLKRAGKGYVWVFTSLEDVVFIYRKSREGNFLSELLKGFRGVMVSDFYAAYDSINCEQQNCLIHLMRDFNHDLLGNPWDEELKKFGSQFGALLRTIVATVDRYGLRRRHLTKHRRDVDNFYAFLSKQVSTSERADSYRTRLLKYRSKLFTFLDHDDVPWNNNNAEHAVKRFAKYRALADGRYSEAGLNQYLLLLSIYVTCKYKRVDFLRFLLSLERDIDSFSQKAKGTSVPTVEVYPDGVVSRHPSRRQTWERQYGRR
jgi:predicted RecB family nuclease